MRVAPLALAAVLVVIPTGQPRAAEGPITGFSGDRTEAQRELETRFDAELDPEDLRSWMRHLSSRPHHVGSPFGREVAEFIAERFREWGYDTQIETYQVLFPTPRVRRLEMVAPTRFTATLQEPTLIEGYIRVSQLMKCPDEACFIAVSTYLTGYATGSESVQEPTVR